MIDLQKYETLLHLLIFIKILYLKINKHILKKDKLISGLLTLILASFIITNFVGPNAYREVIIDGDGSGLYAYLPTIIIYKTIDFTPVFEFEKSRRASDYMGHYFHSYEEILINKFSCGTALLQLPFFLIAYLLSLLIGLEIDGYNVIFQYSVALSAIFWAFIGLIYFVKLAMLYGVKKEYAWLITISGFIGTNLFYYTLIAPAASHIYSFSLISIFLYFTKKSFQEYNRKSIFISSFILGLIVLVRPANILVVMVLPFLSSSPKNFYQLIRNKLAKGDILLIVLVFIIGLSPQLIINYLQTGQLILYGYQNEGFYFNQPEILNFLVSFRKGWFIYTPFMLLLIPAIVTLFKRSRFEFFSFLGFFLILIYIFSSWWNWFYGDSFGMRPMVDYYGIFFLIIALFVSSIKWPGIRLITFIFIGLTTILNLFQTYQYAKGIIHPDSMNREAYGKVFLKTSDEYVGIIAAADESYYGILNEIPFFETMNDMEDIYPGWTIAKNRSEENFSGKYSAQLNNTIIYSPSFSYKIPELLIGKKNLYVFFEAMVLENKINAAKDALFIVDISNAEGQNIFYKKFKVKKLPDDIVGEWRKESIGFKLPELTDDMVQIKFYIWNISKQNFFVDDSEIKIFEYN